MTTRRHFHAQALGLGAAALGLPALAQKSDYPQRPIKVIVPYAAGGGPDVLTRRMAVKLAEVLGPGSVVVVDNIVGAGGILAAQSVARAAPDGYTLLTGASTHVTQKAMQPSVRFDPDRDFAHITLTSVSPQMLVVAANAPYRHLDDLVAAARRAPGQLNYASGGIGSAAHLAGAATVLQAGIEVVHVPYKGSVEIVPSIIAGATQFAFPVASTAIPHIQSGKVRPLAVTSAARMPAYPGVPTLREALRNDDLVLDSWSGLWAPAGTPGVVVERLFKALIATHADPEVRAHIEAAGAAVSVSASPAAFTQFVRAETVKFERIVKAANLKVNG